MGLAAEMKRHESLESPRIYLKRFVQIRGTDENTRARVARVGLLRLLLR